MRYTYLIAILFISSLIYGQKTQLPQELNQLTKIEFHVDGMNNAAAENAVINSINNFPGKIITWVPNITNETILIGFTKNERAIDILELISATGYKPWYINQNGMKVVLVGTNKTEEHYVKP
ncbi:MAG: hypothetical protein IPG89_16940 [Bacteroidetes bacterium]|nr:hypothetical protein [Bacteroidota bacterium]